jgi:hypothetical protein
MSPLQQMRAELYDTPSTAEWLRYWRSLGCDHRTVEAHCGALIVKPVQFFPGRRFDFVEEDSGKPGIPSAIIEVVAADGETSVDLCAWPIGRQDKFATAFGFGGILGAGQIENPATYFGGGKLRAHRTPESWLRAGCVGFVPLDQNSCARAVSACPGAIVAEDVEHGRELARLLHPFFDPAKILFPARRAAA